MKSKVVSLKEAIQEIKDGDCIFSVALLKIDGQ
jgi:acyl CoA:acetate/3-ketoacid CoA transferase alpha subunit